MWVEMRVRRALGGAGHFMNVQRVTAQAPPITAPVRRGSSCAGLLARQKHRERRGVIIPDGRLRGSL